MSRKESVGRAHPTRIASLAGILVLSLVGVGGHAQDSRPTSAPTGDEAGRIASRIAGRVAEVRGLAFKSEAKVGTYSKAQLREFLVANIDEELGNRSVAGRIRGLAKLGYLAPDLDYRSMMLELLGEQIAGFYDPRKKELFLVEVAVDDADAAELNETIMSHELVHALQDQHFDLEALTKDDSNEDKTAALLSLVEGDATLTMMVFEEPAMLSAEAGAGLALMPTSLKALAAMAQMASRAGLDSDALPGVGADMEALAKAPLYVGDAMVFSYLGGMKFCHELATRSATPGMAAIDAAFREPPRSTEQILHPEKYWKQPDWPTTMTLPDLAKTLGAGWSRVVGDTLGELQIRTLMSQFEVKRVARVHAGWDGDRWELWAKDGEADCVVWVSTWDAESDADEFAVGVQTVLGKRFSGYDVADHDTYFCLGKAEGRVVAVVREAKDVYVIADAPAAALSRMVDALKTGITRIDDAPAGTTGR